MRINVLSAQLNEDRLPYIVKEKGINYNEDYKLEPCYFRNMMNNLFHMDDLPNEHCYILCLDTKGKPIGVFFISAGTLGTCIVDPQVVLQRVLLCNARSFLLFHNHPSGDPTPSEADRKLTNRMKEISELMKISFFDHIIIGKDRYYSFARHWSK